MASKLKKLSVAADIFEQTVDGTIRKIPLAHISPSADQPRQEKDINIKALATSLKEDGLLQPIVVTKDGSTQYHIIAGERRFRAAKHLGWGEIECRIINRAGKEKFRLAVIENLQRENLDAYEESRALARLKAEFRYSDQELAHVVGKSRNYVNEILSINEIPEEIAQKAKKKGMNHKNMLVQLAMAHKNGTTDTFFEAFEQGTIASVKSAKEFNRAQKNNLATTKKPITDPLQHNEDTNNNNKKTLSKINIATEASWTSETSIKITTQIENVKETEKPLHNLETFLQKAIEEYFKNI